MLAENRLAIVERPEMRELQVTRRRRRLVVATTTTLLACLSTATTSLSQFVFTTLPFVAQQLQVASNYISWRQVERLQVIYNYSRQLGDYSWSYYNNMTTTPQQQEAAVINVETTTSPQNRLPPLKAPRIEPLGEWRAVRNYLINNLLHAHIYGFNYSEPSRTLGAYYAQFAELQLPSASDDDSDSEEEVASMVETHNMWSPFHYDYIQDSNNPPRTYYICVGESELRAWEDSHRTTLRLAGWKSTTSRVFQHIHLHEHPIEALNYIVALIHNSMSTTLPPWGERLFLIAFNLYPSTTTGRHLMEYYNREGSEYKELENHSDSLQGLDTFTTSTTVIGGPNYEYVRDMMTTAFYKRHLIDVTTISGPDHYYMKSIRHMYNRNYDDTVEFLKENHPDVLRMLQNEEETTGEPTTTTGKKKGVRTTTITADYEVEIVVKQSKKG